MIRTTLAAILVTAAFGAAAQYDLVIRNARIVDGTGSPWYRGDLAIKGNAIAAIAPSIKEQAARVIDAQGQVVSPGFIDVHTHADGGIFERPTADNYTRQGVTTVFAGLDGFGVGIPGTVKPFLDKLEETPRSI